MHANHSKHGHTWGRRDYEPGCGPVRGIATSLAISIIGLLLMALLGLLLAKPSLADQPPAPSTGAITVSRPLPSGAHVRIVQHRKLPDPPKHNGIPTRPSEGFVQAEIWTDNRNVLFAPSLVLRVKVCTEVYIPTPGPKRCLGKMQPVALHLNATTTGEGIREGGSGHLIVSGTYELWQSWRIYEFQAEPYVVQSIGAPMRNVQTRGRTLSRKEVFLCTNPRNPHNRLDD